MDLAGGLLLVQWIPFVSVSGHGLVSCCCCVMAHGCRGWIWSAPGFCIGLDVVVLGAEFGELMLELGPEVYHDVRPFGLVAVCSRP